MWVVESHSHRFTKEVITKDTALMADPETAAIVVEHFSGPIKQSPRQRNQQKHEKRLQNIK